MCAAQNDIISMLKNRNVAADKIDITSLGISFINTCLNPILIFYIFDANLGTQFLSIIIMLQMTFEWFTSIAYILFAFYPVVKNDQLWLNVIICHMWSSTFMYNLFIMFCKYNAVTMLIERCFQMLYPNKNILDYPHTVFTSYCFAMIFVMAINLRFTVVVQVDSQGQCVAAGSNPAHNIHSQQLLVFGYLCLILLLILPAITMTTCYILMLIHYIRKKHSNKNFKGFDKSNLQHILTLLVIIWSVEATMVNILDMTLFYKFQLKGYTTLAQTIRSTTGLVRTLFYLSRTFSLFVFIQPIRKRFSGHILIIVKCCTKVFKHRQRENETISRSTEANF
ncbi:unnamed protein product [Heterobilharzia americana]|nr:unnamed protein product [Heterobilharzia americana]